MNLGTARANLLRSLIFDHTVSKALLQGHPHAQIAEALSVQESLIAEVHEKILLAGRVLPKRDRVKGLIRRRLPPATGRVQVWTPRNLHGAILVLGRRYKMTPAQLLTSLSHLALQTTYEPPVQNRYALPKKLADPTLREEMTKLLAKHPKDGRFKLNLYIPMGMHEALNARCNSLGLIPSTWMLGLLCDVLEGKFADFHLDAGVALQPFDRMQDYVLPAAEAAIIPAEE